MPGRSIRFTNKRLSPAIISNTANNKLYTTLFQKQASSIKVYENDKKKKKLGGLIRQISRAWNKYLKGTSSEFFLAYQNV